MSEEKEKLFPDLTEIVCTRTHPELLKELEEARATLHGNRVAWDYLYSVLAPNIRTTERPEVMPIGARLVLREVERFRENRSNDGFHINGLEGAVKRLKEKPCAGCGRAPNWEKPEEVPVEE